METFTELNLNPSLMQSITRMHFKIPTPIQAQAIPPALLGKDVLGTAQTGTGKTAAFALPILHHLINDNRKNLGIQSLIVTPTRELAIQIGENFTAYSKYNNIKSVVIFGGEKQGGQVAALKNHIDILVATPGRLLDLMNQGFVSLKNINYFVRMRFCVWG